MSEKNNVIENTSVEREGFFERFTTYELVLMAILVSIWYVLQQVWFMAIHAIPVIISWAVSIMAYEIIALSIVMIGAILTQKRMTIFVIFLLHGLIEVILFPNVFSLIGLASDIIPGTLIEAFFYFTGGYPRNYLKSGFGASLRAIVFYPFQLLILGYVTYPEYVTIVEFTYGLSYGVFIVLNVVIGFIFGFIGGILGFYAGMKIKEAL